MSPFHLHSAHLTFEGGEVDPLFDLGLLHQVGGGLRQDELPQARPEAVPVVLHQGNAVLQGARGLPWGLDKWGVSR